MLARTLDHPDRDRRASLQEFVVAHHIHAIALVFHPLLTGALPFPERDPTSKLRGVTVDAEAIGMPCGRWLAPVFQRALAVSPADRCATARELVDRHGGWLALQRRGQGGTRALIVFGGPAQERERAS